MKTLLTLIFTSLIIIENAYAQEIVHNISEEGLDFIKKQELYVDCAYWDINKWAVGYGSREDLKGKTKPFCITEEYATKLLKNKLDIKNNLLMYYYIDNQIEVNQKIHDSLMSLSYNLGSYAVLKSSFIKHIKNKRCDLAAKTVLTYNKAGGIVLKGLVIRRKQEAAMMLEGCKEMKNYYIVETPKPKKVKKK